MISTIVFILYSSFPLSWSDDSTLYAAVIYRHGDRTPVATYPNDPWSNESYWPVKFGELTNIGKQQHYALGQWLRKRYSHLLSPEFEPTEIYVRSTDVDRTLMSAQANLAGMYPPIGKSVWDSHLLWQPIPVHTTPEKEDEVLAMKKYCHAYSKEFEQFVHSDAYKKRLSKYQNLMNYLSACSGMKVKDYEDIVDIYSTLKIESLYNFTLPNWTHSVFPDTLKEPAGYSFKIATATPLMARLKAGPLIKQIVSNMFHSISGKQKHYNVSIYSGHDFTIGNVLNALGLFDGICPEYTSTIFMELIYDNSTSEHFIKISYRNTTDIMEPYVLNIPYCGNKCPIERFVKLYDNLLTVDWENECNKKFAPQIELLFIIGLCLLLTTYFVYKEYVDKSVRHYRLNSGYADLQNSATR